MKKCIALLLILILVFGLVGCSKGKEIEINIDNWDDYFKIEQSVEDLEYKEIIAGYGIIDTATAKLNIRIYPKSNFEVKDISFNLGLMAYYNEWESYDSVDYVSLTEDGHYDNSFKVSLKNGAAVSVITLQEPGYSPLLQDLKGSIIINE